MSGSEDLVRRLQETLGKMESALGAIEDGIAWTDAEGRLQWCNAAFDELTGRPHLAILGAALIDILPLEEGGRPVAAAEHPLTRCLHLGTFTPSAYVARRNGVRRFVEISGAVVHHGAAGKTAILVAHDVTARHLAEEELEHSLSLLRATLESTADGIVVTDVNGRIVSHNRRFAEMWSLPEHLLEAGDEERAMALVLPQLRDPDTFMGVVQDLDARPEVESYDVVELKDARVFERISRPQRLGGRIAGRVWSFRDVTEQRRSEEHLRLLQTITQAVAEAPDLHSALGVALQRVCETTGWVLGQAWAPSTDGKYLECSRAWYASLTSLEGFRAASERIGFEPGVGLPGRVWASSQPAWILDVRTDANFPRAAAAASAGLKAAMGIPVLAGDQVVSVLEFFVVDQREEDARLVALVSGVAAQLGTVIQSKRAEEALRSSEDQLRQAQKMEAVGRLAGGVAHDFNNVLTGILGYSDIILGKLPVGSSLRADVNEIRRTATRAASLSRQLLAFSRRRVLQPKVVDMNAVVADMGKMLRHLIGDDIVLVTSPDPGLWPVHCDPGQLEQVVMNLVVNARDAMPDGGMLDIETANIELDETLARARAGVGPGSWVRLSVRDTGCGMDAEVRSHIFEPFFTTKPVGKGTGLGLATVFGIVTQSGGFIDVDSEPGRGTRFDIHLPRAVAVEDVTVALEPVPSGATGGTETILLVEDDLSLRKMMERVLAEQGYDVLVAPGGPEALQLAESSDRHIDLLLTDVIMPQMTGPALAAELASRGTRPRVIFISGYTESEVIPSGGRVERPAFLEKPFEISDLLRLVRTALEWPA